MAVRDDLREDVYGLLNTLVSSDHEFDHAVELLATWNDASLGMLHAVLEELCLQGDTPELRALASMAVRWAQRRYTDPRMRHSVALRIFVARFREAAGTDPVLAFEEGRDGLLGPWYDDQRVIAKPPHGSRAGELASVLYEGLGICASPACPSEGALHLLASFDDEVVAAMREIVEEQALYGLDPEARVTAAEVLRELFAETPTGERHANVTAVLAFVERLRLLDGGSRLPRRFTLTRNEFAVRGAETLDRLFGQVAARRDGPAPEPTNPAGLVERLEKLEQRYDGDPERYRGDEGMARFQRDSVDELVDEVLQRARDSGR